MPNTTRTDRSSSSHPSPTAASVSSWAPPRAPLAPHRLAKLANALGVSTPMPATHGRPSMTSPSLPNSSASASFPDHFRRSPTPSTSSTQAFTPTASTSKYLLHVIPPYHLNTDISDALELTPMPSSATGYHTQFQRGILVPVYPTLQSQLGAIAREYALPSTTGIVLYLSASVSERLSHDEPEGMGPRLSEDIWRHIWIRVLRAERDESPTPGPKQFGLGLGFGMAGRSSPALLQDVLTNSASLRSPVFTGRTETPQPLSATYPLTPSPSTPSNSAYSSQSELDPSESASSVYHSGPDGIPLPGLNSPSLIPVLAKVEFDIDKRKAGWYEPWLRSRRAAHAKRAESRTGSRSRLGSTSESGEVDEDDDAAVTKKAPLDLELVNRMQTASPAPSFLMTKEAPPMEEEEEEGADADGSYQRLSESPEEGELDPDDLDEEELTAVLNGAAGADPLADVFGSDAQTWADIHAESSPRRASKQATNPNVVDLALDAAALSSLPESLEEDSPADIDDVAEVNELLSRPPLVVSIPSSPPSASKRRSSPTTAGTIKKHVPPPLALHPGSELALPVQISPNPDSAGSAHLAYLSEGPTPPLTDPIPDSHDGEDGATGEDSAPSKIRSPQEEKRAGTFFGELDLGLDPSLTESAEFDDDPYDRRKSQFIMAAQLDEIEKTLAQFSPRQLKTDTLTDEFPLPPTTPALSPPLSAFSDLKYGPTSPPKKSPPLEGASWPAVPYAALNGHDSDRGSGSQRGSDNSPPVSPPRIAFNGISTELPKSPYQRKSRQDSESDESAARRRALEEEEALYPPLVAPNLYRDPHSNSPVIPLSPDPFGRYPSEIEVPVQVSSAEHGSNGYLTEPSPHGETFVSRPARGPSLAVSVETERPASQTPSSRFSLDSVNSEDNANLKVAQQKHSSSLVSVKSISKLWRRSNKGSISNPTPELPESGRSSPNPPLPNGQNGSVGRSRGKSVSKTMPPPPPPSDAVPTFTAALNVPVQKPSIRQFRFDQDSPYPIHPSRPPPPPSISGTRTPSPPVPPVPSRPPSVTQTRPPSISQHPAPNAEKSSGVRKSILKSWKSASGSLSVQSSRGSISKPNSSTATPRSSTEQTTEPTRRRRPSVIEIATNAMRGSIVSVASTSPGYVDIPPSPALPEEFLNHNHMRTSSRQSQVTLNGVHSSSDKRDSVRPRPSMSSSNSSPPRVRSPLTASSPPRKGLGSAPSRMSGESYESRPSFDVSQFEMVSPPRPDSHLLESALSYPYHGLDHSMTSYE